MTHREMLVHAWELSFMNEIFNSESENVQIMLDLVGRPLNQELLGKGFCRWLIWYAVEGASYPNPPVVNERDVIDRALAQARDVFDEFAKSGAEMREPSKHVICNYYHSRREEFLNDIEEHLGYANRA